MSEAELDKQIEARIRKRSRPSPVAGCLGVVLAVAIVGAVGWWIFFGDQRTLDAKAIQVTDAFTVAAWNRTTAPWPTEPARDAAGLHESLTFHQLRHAAASRLIASGLDDELIADQLGHGDTNLTRRIYGHVYDRAERDAAIRKAFA